MRKRTSERAGRRSFFMEFGAGERLWSSDQRAMHARDAARLSRAYSTWSTDILRWSSHHGQILGARRADCGPGVANLESFARAFGSARQAPVDTARRAPFENGAPRATTKRCAQNRM